MMRMRRMGEMGWVHPPDEEDGWGTRKERVDPDRLSLVVWGWPSKERVGDSEADAEECGLKEDVEGGEEEVGGRERRERGRMVKAVERGRERGCKGVARGAVCAQPPPRICLSLHLALDEWEGRREGHHSPHLYLLSPAPSFSTRTISYRSATGTPSAECDAITPPSRTVSSFSELEPPNALFSRTPLPSTAPLFLAHRSPTRASPGVLTHPTCDSISHIAPSTSVSHRPGLDTIAFSNAYPTDSLLRFTPLPAVLLVLGPIDTPALSVPSAHQYTSLSYALTRDICRARSAVICFTNGRAFRILRPPKLSSHSSVLA
ncbi:hypothetical protein NUW54_g12817 [Trametes sanguinea]|uniref:Uncharacterized protein n=1 Tax=Trametes sanguinea TaxID=158606 RepID=A0ACC1MTL2_9APHY|nr:hypothetical protein NUW54_g12817 [Trametes sanguinea]